MSALHLRPANPLDLPPLYALAEDHKHKFLDDYTTFSPDYARLLLADENTLVIDDGYGYAVGAFWFDDTRDDLHTTIHMLIRPEYYRALVKADLGKLSADHAFYKMGVARIYAFPMHTQTNAIKYLKRYGFYSHLPWRSHTKQGGKRVDTIFMELKKSNWEKRSERREKTAEQE